MTETHDYETGLELVKHAYEDRAMTLLSRIAAACRAAGLTVPNGPYDFSVDTYQWSLTVYRTPLRRDSEDLADVTLEIVEERDYDDEEGWGINFGLVIAEWGGRVLAERQLYNFTPGVWADIRDTAGLEQRWAEFTSINPDQAASRITTGRQWNTDGWYRGQRPDSELELAIADMDYEGAGVHRTRTED